MAATPQDVANPGLIRPPFVFLASILLGVLLQFALPLPFVTRGIGIVAGPMLVVMAIALFVSSVAKFRAAGTPVPAQKPTTAIVATGPYRFSRNPIYLAFSLLQAGVAIWVNSLWLLGTLVVAVALMHFVVIRREEQYLERKFGATYLAYKVSVRRWL